MKLIVATIKIIMQTIEEIPMNQVNPVYPISQVNRGSQEKEKMKNLAERKVIKKEKIITYQHVFFRNYCIYINIWHYRSSNGYIQIICILLPNFFTTGEFNDLLTKYRQQEGGMTEEQAVCARDIRRRGKNKVFFAEPKRNLEKM